MSVMGVVIGMGLAFGAIAIAGVIIFFLGGDID